MRIGFDLDGIFIDTPPFVPKKVIEWLYRERANHVLSYRMPSKFERLIRKLSHHSVFRPHIEKNIRFVKQRTVKNAHSYYLISGRFGFLKNQTDRVLAKYGLAVPFDKIYLNESSKQPHLFKRAVLRRLRIDRYVDDDLPLLMFLARKQPNVTFFWLNKKLRRKLRTNLFALTSLADVVKKP